MNDYVFLSYSRKDQKRSNQIRSLLLRNGIPVWRDKENIPSGARFDEEIAAAIDHCSCMVLLLTEASLHSKIVLAEAAYASRRKKIIIPLQLDSPLELAGPLTYHISPESIYEAAQISERNRNIQRFLQDVYRHTDRFVKTKPPASKAPFFRTYWKIGLLVPVILLGIVLLPLLRRQPKPEQSQDSLPDNTYITTVKTQIPVRSSPTADAIIIGSLESGTEITIRKTEIHQGMEWGLIQEGWISMHDLSIDDVFPTSEGTEPVDTVPSTEATEPVIVIPPIMATEPVEVIMPPETTEPVEVIMPPETTEPDYQNMAAVLARTVIRSSPSTGAKVIGFLDPGTEVEIIKTEPYMGVEWALIREGWVLMDDLSMYDGIPIPEVTKPAEVIAPPETSEPDSQNTATVMTRTDVRSSPSTGAKIIGYLDPGTQVQIIKTESYMGTEWALIREGWILVSGLS